MTRADQVISYGMAEIGEPYVWGADGPDAFDCSGLMQFVFGKVGLSLPRTAREQQKYATRVSNPRPGDLVFWGSPATHVGLYLGGGRFLAAPHAGANVRTSTVYGSPTYGRVPGLGLADGLMPVGFQPIAAGGSAPAGIGASAKSAMLTGLVALGGVALIAAGGWQATKGETP